MTVVSMDAGIELVTAPPASRGNGLARFARPLLGLLVPVVLAVGWELAVRAGLSNGRLVPPPSRIYAQFDELARSISQSVVLPRMAKITMAATICGGLPSCWPSIRR